MAGAPDRRGRPGGAAAGSQRRPRRARPRLHPRDAARALDAREPLLPGRGARAPEHPGGGPGAARGQPLGRQPHARHARLHARVQHLLRRRAPLPSAGPQPRALDAGTRHAAQVRHGGRHAGERRAGARLGRGAARLSRAATTRCTGPPGSPRAWTSAAAGLHPAGASQKGVPLVPVVSDRRSGDRAVPLARRGPRAAARASTACSA